MNNRLNTTSVREIKSSLKRFVSLLVMSMLGVGVFVGLEATKGDMTKSLDTYYDNNNLYDIKFISTLGITDKEIEKLNSLPTIDKVYYSYSKDVILKSNENESIAKIIGITDEVNQITIKNGRLPEDTSEILVEQALLDNENLKVGDSIQILDEETFKNTILKIVGVVKSPIYISSVTVTPNRGNTNLGTGKINYYIYTLNDNFKINYYTEAYATVLGGKKKETSSDEYNNLIKESLNNIESIRNDIEKSRYEEIYNLYYNEIEKNRLEGQRELDSAKIKLDSANYELINAKNTLDSSKIVLNNSKIELDSNKEKLDSANTLLLENKTKLDNAKKEIDTAIFNLEEKLNNYGLTIEDIKKFRERLKHNNISENTILGTIDDIKPYTDLLINDDILDAITSATVKEIINNDILLNTLKDIINTDVSIDSILENTNLTYDEKNTIRELINNSKLFNYIKGIINYQERIEKVREIVNNDDLISKIRLILNTNLNRENINELLDLTSSDIKLLLDGLDTLEEYSNQYADGINEYNGAIEEYNNSYNLYNSYYDEYQNGLDEYNKGLRLYNYNFMLYNKNLEEYYNSLNMFNTKINDALLELENIPESILYVYDRTGNDEYVEYINDAESVANLAKVFPIIFFAVAVLISLISMSRMVEDDRVEIGTLKSLGFSNNHIRKKYIIYSGLATLLGGLIGSVLGFYLLPRFIFNIYKILFDVPVFEYKYDLTNFVFGILISIICICGTTLYTIKKVVREKPSELMRPKAPKIGKKIFLEKIQFIWNKINFSNKVMIRNLFRYKKRVLMTMFGIIGCTALMLAGFGIRDSIVDIPEKQYREIFNFDDLVYLTRDFSEEEMEQLFNNEHIISKLSAQMIVSDDSIEYGITIFVPSNKEDLKNILILRDKKTKEEITLKTGKIVITDKFAQLKKKKVGDTLILKDAKNNPHTFEISGICENYIAHYVFMDKETYESNMGIYKSNIAYYTIDDSKYDDEIAKNLLENDGVMSITSMSVAMDSVYNMLKSLNSVVLILIILSGALSFVVLYNLSYINITERKREIATLKVLGFNDKEVDNYIIKETIILTIAGIILGLLLGTFVTNIIVDTVEIEMVRFLHKINLFSYILTSILILGFTTIVSIIIHFYLKKVDMIESLKSIE